MDSQDQVALQLASITRVLPRLSVMTTTCLSSGQIHDGRTSAWVWHSPLFFGDPCTTKPISTLERATWQPNTKHNAQSRRVWGWIAFCELEPTAIVVWEGVWELRRDAKKLLLVEPRLRVLPKNGYSENIYHGVPPVLLLSLYEVVLLLVQGVWPPFVFVSD